MSGDDNIATLRRIYAVFSTGDLDELDDCVAENVVDHNPDPGQGPGLQGVKDAFTGFRQVVSDLRFEVDEILALDDKVVSRGRMSGTDSGGLIPGSPPSGKSFTADHIDIVRFEGGKAAERWGLTDMAAIMMQLGAIPEPSEAGAG